MQTAGEILNFLVKNKFLKNDDFVVVDEAEFLEVQKWSLEKFVEKFGSKKVFCQENIREPFKDSLTISYLENHYSKIENYYFELGIQWRVLHWVTGK